MIAIDLALARRLALSVVLGQAVVTLICALAAWLISDSRAAISALLKVLTDTGFPPTPRVRAACPSDFPSSAARLISSRQRSALASRVRATFC